MDGLKNMSEDDLVDMMKMHFHLLAETFSELAGRDDENDRARMGVIKGGYRVDCSLLARKND